MLVSLNKKFIYTIVAFFIITAIIFLYSFYLTFGRRLQNDFRENIHRNQEYIDLLYENNQLKKELLNVQQTHSYINLPKEINPVDFFSLETTISKEKQRINQLQNSYNNRYASIYEGIKIIATSSILIILSLLLLWFLLNKWVLYPIKILTSVSKDVAQGNLSQRVVYKQKRFLLDEIDFLIDTFNQMLDKLEDGIKEIQDTETFLQKIIDGIPDGLRVIDQDHNIIIANKTYYQQVGSKQKDLKCYESAQHRTSPCNLNTTTCPLYEICRKNKKHAHVIQQFAHKPNKHLYINAAPLKIEDKLLIIEIIRDLSNDIKYSHQQKIASLGFLATSVAHEMKNHLGAIRIILERLLTNTNISQTEQKKLLELVLQQIVESIDVPERLLKLSHPSTNQTEEINCYQNIKDIISLLDYEAKRHGISIKTEGDKNIKIIGNEIDFKMIFINLILNAIKAGKPNGEIIIHFAKDKKYNTIQVQDNGKGIEKSVLPHIFDPFYSNGKEGDFGGNGLGLAIVKSIVEKQKGHISVDSEAGQGTCFNLQFPAINKK